MSYIDNPKTKGSGIICCIPQSTKCPMNCKDCFFQSGRSYLEPLEENLPNIPELLSTLNRVVRVNDGNDSSIDRQAVSDGTYKFADKFYNTSNPENLESYIYPVVLTINPGTMTDTDFHRIEEPPKNLMFVRYRTNTWNFHVCESAVEWYSNRCVPIVLTFMAYHDLISLPTLHEHRYEWRERTINSYLAIKYEYYKNIMGQYGSNRWVYSCGTEGVESRCRWCGNCLREYYATIERMRS